MIGDDVALDIGPACRAKIRAKTGTRKGTPIGLWPIYQCKHTSANSNAKLGSQQTSPIIRREMPLEPSLALAGSFI